MSQAVKCWMVDADGGDEGEDDAITVEAYDARDAAQKFIERRWEAMDGQLYYEVMTRDTFGVLRRFEVVVEAEPVFVASEVRPRRLPAEPGTGEPPAPPNTEQGRGTDDE